MAKLTDKLFNRVIEGKFVAQSGDELPKELPAVSAVDNGKALVVSGGKWVAGTISGGTQLYKHAFHIVDGENVDEYDMIIISSSNTPITSLSNVLGIIVGEIKYDINDPTPSFSTFITIYEEDNYVVGDKAISHGVVLGTDTVTPL